MYTEQLTQALAVLGQVKSQTLNNSNDNCTDMDMSKVRRIMAVINVGAVTGGGSLSVKFQESKTAGGAYQDLVAYPASLTAITASNKVATLEVREDQLDAGYRYVKLILTETGSQNVVCGAIVLGGEAEAKPAKANDIAAVTQRNVV
jgi:hypothetical protein